MQRRENQLSYVMDNFDMFSRIIKGIAAQFGENCEVVLHDLTRDYEHTIVAIENGHVTGRKVGDSGTNMGLEILRGTSSGSDQYNYVNRTLDNKIIKSSSIYLNDEDGNITGSICINFDITGLLAGQREMNAFISVNPENAMSEHFSGNIDDLMDYLIEQSLDLIGKPISEMTKKDKMKAIEFLEKKGIFLIMKSMDKVADRFQISKFSIYNYLDEIRGSDSENAEKGKKTSKKKK